MTHTVFFLDKRGFRGILIIEIVKVFSIIERE
jgi:hypothetical protein